HSSRSAVMSRFWSAITVILLLAGTGLGAWWLLAPDPGTPPGPAPEGMVWVPGGWFTMGSPDFDDAQPVHRVWVDGFWMDETEVTNAQFRRFVEATGYKTVAERVPARELMPNVPEEKLKGARPFSLVFVPPDVCPEGPCNCDLWWKMVEGA